MGGVNPYQRQIDNVVWSVGPNGKLRIEVDLYGEGTDTQSGNVMVARSAGWQEVDRERFAGYAFRFSLTKRGPDWLGLCHERAIQENLLKSGVCDPVKRLTRYERFAAAAGMSVEEWQERRDRRSLDECWKEAAKVYQQMYGVRLPGYTGRVRLARRREKGAGKRKHGRTAKEAK